MTILMYYKNLTIINFSSEKKGITVELLTSDSDSWIDKKIKTCCYRIFDWKEENCNILSKTVKIIHSYYYFINVSRKRSETLGLRI